MRVVLVVENRAYEMFVFDSFVKFIVFHWFIGLSAYPEVTVTRSRASMYQISTLIGKVSTIGFRGEQLPETYNGTTKRNHQIVQYQDKLT